MSNLNDYSVRRCFHFFLDIDQIPIDGMTGIGNKPIHIKPNLNLQVPETICPSLENCPV
jgi:hypothetical protein